ncbi:NAD(P)-dependent alcohol dehydrogenase [Mycolicibacterium llatzerense]|uniref:NAD(P)-dependent alcohol dehydrogenase n=1 Tax=Mycolicibacterium llatzerense TaxID=280871 RepID=UPI0021B4F596|nr:NAD(P)-dependent alcohol dehydrogenase [Mycolicibacterium llatzerense]MCT7365853.1 aryl-alcohol dehydrogenase [Mycolicibacterium llatzerense]
MLAAVTRSGAESFVVESVDLDDIREDEILVKVVASGICQTDLWFKRSRASDAPPAVLGHEAAGIVEQVGPSVVGVRPGDHVVLSFRHCGQCSRCQMGNPAYCRRGPSLNLTGRRIDGSAVLHQNGEPLFGSFLGQSSFAQYAVATVDNAIVIDNDVDFAVAAPLGCGLLTGASTTMNVLCPDTDARMVVYGAGAVGLAALMAAAAAGVRTLIAVDPVPSRRALAERLGASVTVDPTTANVVAAVTDLTKGGATHAVDTSGVAESIHNGLRSLATNGTFAAVGLGAPQVTVDMQMMVLKGLTFRGSSMGDCVPAKVIPALVRLYRAGRFPVQELVTAYAATDINQAVADAASGATIKPVLLW